MANKRKKGKRKERFDSMIEPPLVTGYKTTPSTRHKPLSPTSRDVFKDQKKTSQLYTKKPLVQR
jgi:hypothetical protein